jgi:hypothetical protein
MSGLVILPLGLHCAAHPELVVDEFLAVNDPTANSRQRRGYDPAQRPQDAFAHAF